MDIDYKALGERVRSFRTNAGLKQETLAEIIKVEPSTISHIERGTTKVSLPNLVKIANVFNASMDELLYDNINKNGHITCKIIDDLLNDCTEKELMGIAEIIKVSKDVIRKQ